MKISEVIKKLEQYKKDLGDIDLEITGYDPDYQTYGHPFEDLEITNNDGMFLLEGKE